MGNDNPEVKGEYSHYGLCSTCRSFTPSNPSFGVCERHRKTMHTLGKCSDYIAKDRSVKKPIQDVAGSFEPDEKETPPAQPTTGSLF